MNLTCFNLLYLLDVHESVTVMLEVQRCHQIALCSVFYINVVLLTKLLFDNNNNNNLFI